MLDALTGVLVIDRSSASATGLYALKDEAWDTEALSLAHTDADHLAPVVPTDHVLDALTARAKGEKTTTAEEASA